MAKAKPKKKRKKKTGRPLTEIDPEEVEKLAKLHCTNVEIADFFGVDEATIRKRFSDILTKSKAEGKMSLRRLQWKRAVSGNTAMLIWLGKQILDQKEQIETTIPEGIDIRVTYAKNKRNAK